MKRIALFAAVITALTLAGCANIDITVKTKGGSSDATEQPAGSQKSVVGPYGELCVNVPDDWECKICPLDSEEMSYGYYGFTMHPKDAKEGIVAIFCATRFGVCGTELKQEETTIAGKPARIGTYDGHKRWDFIVIGDDDPQIVATNGVCDSWTDDQWDTAQSIIDTIEFDTSNTAGAVWQYTPESEDTDIGVSMDLSDITPSKATVHFYRFETGNAGELSYGESFILEKENAGKWEAVPKITDEAAFTDMAYIIPVNETSEIETNWEWLYGQLSPGTYRIRKIVLNCKDDGCTEHELVAQFLLAGPAK